MAVDEALLESAVSPGMATLRWYRWCEPTVSLGYFQRSADFFQDPTLGRLAVVRRLTGGGAILHDDELTYSVSLPSTQAVFSQPHELYDIIHGAICNGLRRLGFPVFARGTTFKLQDEPLLCFQRKDAHDIVLNGCKVLGSAQRRRQGAIMQHGSLIRRASKLATQIPGLVELCPSHLPPNLAEILNESVVASIADSWAIEPLSEREIVLAQDLCENAMKNVRSR